MRDSGVRVIFRLLLGLSP